MTSASAIGSAEPLLIFLHNLKTGGTTLRTIVQRQYPVDAVHTVGGRPEEFGGPKHVGQIELDKTRVVQGHIPFGLHEALPGQSSYITMLRDPVERMISLYYFTLHSPERAIHRESGDHLASLEEFVSSGALLETDNGQTRRLSGLRPSFGQCSAEMLERAKENVRAYFSVVGLSERFDESLLLMKRLFGWTSIFYLREKATRRRPNKADLPDRVIRTVLEYNQLDRQLYRFAGELLDQALADQGDDLASELQAFTRLNAKLAARSVRTVPTDQPTDEPETDSATSRLLDAHARLLSREADLQRETLHLSRQARHREKELRSLRKELRSSTQELARARDRMQMESTRARRFGI